jgi:hypothetical protein
MINHPQRADRKQESDDSCAAIQRALLECGYVALRQVRCYGRGDVVHLEGIVPSFYLKQIAQKAAQNVECVRTIENRITVHRAGQSGERDPTRDQ